MATAAEILAVRQNINDLTEPYAFTDEAIGIIIDSVGGDAATASLWRTKAATYSESVDVTEAGASHKFSDLQKNALLMAASWDKVAAGVTTPEEAIAGSPRVRVIERR
jgi:hypothetical protein